MENRTMPYFGLRTGFGASTTLPFQRPRGLGRGYRPSHSMSHPPFIGNGATRRDSTEYLRDLHERDRLSKALHKLSASLGDDQFARLHKEVIAETEKLSRSAAKLALKMTNKRDQIFNGANTDRCPKEQSTFQDRGRYISATDTRRVSRNNTFGKAITIPMFWGETVVLHISWETCWVPMKLLEKIFNCPGVLLGAFSGCFRHSSVTSPDNSVCFDCLLTLRMRFHHFLSNETRPILDNLQHILERNFKHRNGYVLHKSSPLCMYRNTSPL